MAPVEDAVQIERMSDAAVAAKTGKAWPEWFALLDAADAHEMSHKQIVAYLAQQHSISLWWQQMITVTYEKERGLRQKHQMPDGYQISGNKTIEVSVETLYLAWLDEGTRNRWLPNTPIMIRKATPNSSLRITWTDGTTHVDVGFYAKGEHKSQVSLQHRKLPDGEAAEQMKGFWTETLNQLKLMLEDSTATA